MKKTNIRLRPEEAVLVVVDVQERLAAVMARRDQVVKNIRVLVRLAKLAGIPIMVTQQYTKGLGPTVPELASELAASPPVEKITFSCCGEDSFTRDIRRLGKEGRRTVILTGMEAHVCVLMTAVDLMEEGFDIHIPWDAVCSRSDDNRDWALRSLLHAGAVVTSTETEAFFALGRAGTPEFKEISALVR